MKNCADVRSRLSRRSVYSTVSWRRGGACIELLASASTLGSTIGSSEAFSEALEDIIVGMESVKIDSRDCRSDVPRVDICMPRCMPCRLVRS